MKKCVAIVLLALLFVANVLILAPTSLGLPGADVYGQLNLLVDVRHELVSGYVEELAEPEQQEMIRAAVRGMIESLGDPHTAYLSPEDLKRFDRETMGSFSGIGAEVMIEPTVRRLQIVSPIEDTPAWNAGVMAGDIVLEIDDVDTLDLPLSDAVEKLVGKAGTKVTILVRHESGEEELITITRAQINVSTIRGMRRDAEHHWQFMIDPEHKIGYVRIRQFSGTTAADLKAALQDLMAAGMRGLILDLRFNPGGLLQSAVAVADMFLDPGQAVVSVKGRAVPEYVHRSTHEQIASGVEIVVLANRASASAAEIITGALADNGRARFVGARTFGKGSVQQLRELDNGQGALKLTNAFWYTPNGTRIHKVPKAETWGVDPEDGFFVVMNSAQIKKMFDIRRAGDILRRSDDGNGNGPRQLTPDWIEQEMADLQLAAGLKTLLGKLETGQWPVVGQAGADLLAKQAKIEGLIRQRQRLQEGLARTDEELMKLESGAEEEPEVEPSAQRSESDPAAPSDREKLPEVLPVESR